LPSVPLQLSPSPSAARAPAPCLTSAPRAPQVDTASSNDGSSLGSDSGSYDSGSSSGLGSEEEEGPERDHPQLYGSSAHLSGRAYSAAADSLAGGSYQPSCLQRGPWAEGEMEELLLGPGAGGAVPSLQELCQRAVARELVEPRTALQILEYADLAGGAPGWLAAGPGRAGGARVRAPGEWLPRRCWLTGQLQQQPGWGLR
jgi:hypothetical protein